MRSIQQKPNLGISHYHQCQEALDRAYFLGECPRVKSNPKTQKLLSEALEAYMGDDLWSLKTIISALERIDYDAVCGW